MASSVLQSIPEALKPEVMKSVETMEIETNVLDPIVINQSFCRFVLERKGILDMGSVVTLAVRTSPGASGEAFLPIKTGIHALIQRAVLRIGSRVVAITDEYGTYQTIRRQFKTPEEKSQKDMVKSGTIDVVCPDIAQTGKLQLRDAVYDTAGDATVLSQYALKASDQETPVFSIRLSELFPAMREVQLPLYLIAEPCSIELTFKSQGASNAQEGTICCFKSTVVEANKAVQVSTANVKFLADYLTYDDGRMDDTAKQVMSESGMPIPYEDIVMTSTNFPAEASAPSAGSPSEQKIVRDLGLSGMSVRAIVAHMKKPGVHPLLGQYSSDAYTIPDKYNVRLNDKQIYPRELSSETVKSHELGLVYGTDISVSSGEYSQDVATDKSTADHTVTNQVFTAKTFEGHAQTSLLGSQHYLGVDLSISPLNTPGNSVQVGQKPVQFLHTVSNTSTDYAGREVKYFSSVERMMTIKAGQVMVSA